MDWKALPYFRLLLRKKMNLFPILTDKMMREDTLEVFIRGIDVGGRSIS